LVICDVSSVTVVARRRPKCYGLNAMTVALSRNESRRRAPVSRRRFIVLGTAALLATPWPARALIPLPPPGRITFEVRRAGVAVGSHSVDIADRAGRREVSNAIDIVVNALGVTLYLFKQRSVEIWSSERLTSFESETTEDDASFWVKGRALADGFDVQSRKDRATAPADIMVATYWRPEICRQRRLIEPKRGRLREQTLLSTRRLTFATSGGEVPADEYRIRGILDGACTYDERGVWLGAWFDKKGRVDYRVAT
jgi:hypothetical protein